MICRLCDKENEFYKNQSICKECYNKRYKERYILRKQKTEYPKARCEKCDNLFQLEFDPIREKDKILDKWLCVDCL